MPTLSILICRLPDREASYNRLHDCIARQYSEAADHSWVEVLTDSTPPHYLANGERAVETTTGAKRNALLRRAVGDYIAFIDDDDMVAPDYLEKIHKAIKEGPDVLGFEGALHHSRNGRVERFIHSLKYDKWWEEPDRDVPGHKIYYRYPNHLNPVRRRLAIEAGFPGQTHGEDHVYSTALKPLLKSEIMLQGVMYHYMTV